MKPLNIRQIIKEEVKEAIKNYKDYTYHENEKLPAKYEKLFTSLVQSYYDETGIIIEKVSVGGLNVKNEKVVLVDVEYSGGDKRNLHL